MRRWLSHAVLALALSPLPASAQFVTPLPRPLEGKDVKRDLIYRALLDSVAAIVQDVESPGDSAAIFQRLLNVLSQRCEEVYGPPSGQRTPADSVAINACTNSVSHDELRDIASKLASIEPLPAAEAAQDERAKRRAQAKLAERARDAVPRVLNYPGFFPIRRADLIPYFRATDFESLSILRQFSAQVKEDHAFILTETLAGSISFLLFGVTYAAVAIKGDPKQIRLGEDDVMVDISADTVREITGTVSRLVNNGGTISGRFQYPIFAGGGTNVQHASSLYTQIGALGPAGATDSLSLSGAVVLEYVAGLSVRQFDASDEVSAELVVGFRLGWAGSESRLAPQLADAPGRLDAKSTWFLQLGVGVAEIGGTGFQFSALVTPPWLFDDELEDFIPRAVINLAMLR